MVAPLSNVSRTADLLSTRHLHKSLIRFNATDLRRDFKGFDFYPSEYLKVKITTLDSQASSWPHCPVGRLNAVFPYFQVDE